MKLQDCTYGKLVCQLGKSGKAKRVGMVAGITNNLRNLDSEAKDCPTRAQPLVEWSCGHKSNINPVHLVEFKNKYL